MILYHEQAKPLKDMSEKEIIDYYHIDKKDKHNLIDIVVNNTICYSKYHNYFINVKIEWKNHTIYTQIRKSYDKYIIFKKIDDNSYSYELDDNIYDLEYKNNAWFYCGIIYQGEVYLLLNDLKKATCFLEIRETYLKIKMLPLINDIYRYIGLTLINYNELNHIKVF